MTGRTPPQAGAHDALLDKKTAEKRRLAEALRANLRRRKAPASRDPAHGRPAGPDLGSEVEGA